jgi:hypothetical protein
MRNFTALLVVVVALASGCSSYVQPDAGPPRTMLLENIEHDGHSWVAAVYCGIQITALEHHPDCPCTKRRRVLPEHHDEAGKLMEAR